MDFKRRIKRENPLAFSRILVTLVGPDGLGAAAGTSGAGGDLVGAAGGDLVGRGGAGGDAVGVGGVGGGNGAGIGAWATVVVQWKRKRRSEKEKKVCFITIFVVFREF